ncbi:hypothetical protein EDD52_103256 [Primorskyibacter sedentarius]|uniref:Uncharacterized protein n=1 Tax=Primorskyibacter sedentarius TaxID=745311 RepID=A0A4R3JI20_9RHOB|nr:hypothetical protein EDD52_103256 [Primorskyibacter sedentarius]
MTADSLGVLAVYIGILKRFAAPTPFSNFVGWLRYRFSDRDKLPDARALNFRGFLSVKQKTLHNKATS